MGDTTKLNQEKTELNELINKGISFEVTGVEVQEKKRFRIFKRRVCVPVKMQFKIEEPTLKTLDRLSYEWIEFAIDESILRSEDGIQRARELAHEHSIRCARVVAIAALGSDREIATVGKNGVVKYVEDVQRLEYLTDLFARTIKPSRLYQLYVLINAMCNLGDFLNSIRLMQTDRTTMPIRIEEDKRV